MGGGRPKSHYHAPDVFRTEMALRKCPVCSAPVKLENLGRHIANVHPERDVSMALTREEQRTLRAERRKSAPGFRVKRRTIVIAAALSLIAAGAVVASPYLFHGSGGPIHWHPHLRIIIDGQAVTITANIGIDPGFWQDHSLDAFGMQGMAPLHTHDASGTIHVESRVTREYTLGEFVRIWGQSFDDQQVLGHAAQPGHAVWLVVDGARASPSSALALRDGMNVEIVCDVA